MKKNEQEGRTRHMTTDVTPRPPRVAVLRILNGSGDSSISWDPDRLAASDPEAEAAVRQAQHLTVQWCQFLEEGRLRALWQQDHQGRRARAQRASQVPNVAIRNPSI